MDTFHGNISKNSFRGKVIGTLLLTGEKVSLSGGLPTMKINDSWLDKSIEDVNNNIDRLKNTLEILKNLDIPKKVKSEISKED